MRLGRTTAILVTLLLAAWTPVQAATYHVDAIAGNDVTGDGSEAAPLASLAKVRPLLEGGDTVILYDGDYGSIEEVRSGVVDLYDDWVTYRAAPDASPTIEHIYFGYNAGSYIGPQDQTGAYDVYLRFEGLHIKDGLASYGARHWALVNCLVERYGPWTGSVAAIEKTAVFWRGGTDILIADCEITNTGTALAGRGRDIDILGNHIHGGSHDGLRVTGFWNALIEGNVIHDFDDGVTDAEASWSRHCDGIHIFVPGPETPGWQNHNVIFRNNIVYDCEAQIVQFNNYGAVQNEMIVFENNVFGPGNAPMFNNADPCDTLIFRHNSVIYTPGGRVFNRWICDNYTLRISDESTDVEIYNNILGSTGIEVGADVQVFDWNLIQIPGTPIGVGSSRAYGRFTLIGDDPRFLAPADMDYRTAGDSPAINAGTRLFAPDPLYNWDYEGILRDNRPDLGVYEFAGLSPEAEEPLEEYPGPKTVFVDDFEDGHYADIDPWLEGPGQQGLSWHQLGDVRKYYVTLSSLLERNALFEPTGAADEQRVCWIVSDQGANWTDYTFEFNGWNSYLTTGGGPILLVQDEQNCYWLDIGRDTGRLIRLMTDAEGSPTTTVLESSAAIELPHYGSRRYRITVTHETDAIGIEVDADADDSVELSYRDTDALALAKFATGPIGFHGNVMDQYHKIHYDNVAVTLSGDPPQSDALTILAWEVLENHGSAGDLAVPATDNHVAATLDGIHGLRVTFTEAVDPATVSNNVVSILGTLSGSLSATVSSVALDATETQMTITLSDSLPDEDRYVVTIAAGVTTPEGVALSGPRDRVLSALAGDINGSGTVSSSDIAAIRTMVGSAVNSTTGRFDVDLSGVITAVDMLAVRALHGHTLP
jgi:Right handed beta helix region/Bacterial Ig-like domain/Dockerin type I domain